MNDQDLYLEPGVEVSEPSSMLESEVELSARPRPVIICVSGC